MSVSIYIEPHHESVDMYGEPDERAAYSLSGNVLITLSSPFSLFEHKQDIRIILQSLLITFEGQTELVTEETGYSALRLCSVSKDLVLGEPVQLGNENSDDPSGFCVWSVVFNLTIPGWLPASTPFGDPDGGTRYGLYVHAMIEYLEDTPSRSWFSAFCSSFQPSSKIIKTEKPIRLDRYISPSMIATTSVSAFPLTHFGVSAQASQIEEPSAFPVDVLTKVRAQVSVPERVAIGEDSMPFTIRLRTEGLPECECIRLRVTFFFVDIEQVEKYRITPHPGYLSCFPVPPEAEQPPLRKLNNPHPVHSFYDGGFPTTKPPADHVLMRTLSLLPDDCSGQYSVGGDGYIFKDDAREGEDRTWFSLSASVPVFSSPLLDLDDWKQDRSVRASVLSPFFNVNHRLHVILTCTYDIGDGTTLEPERAMAHLRFHIPLRFVHTPPIALPIPSASTPPADDMTRLSYSGTSSSSLDLPLPSAPYAQPLPAYSQLYDENGDRKVDYNTPLPLYTPLPGNGDTKVLPLSNNADEP